MLLDLLTIFFIVAGCLLLWFNLRPKGEGDTNSNEAPRRRSSGGGAGEKGEARRAWDNSLG
jgi:hypothetical protein